MRILFCTQLLTSTHGERPGSLAGERPHLASPALILGMDPVAFPIDLLGRRAVQAEEGLGHRQRHFTLATEYEIGPGAAELRLFPEVGGAGDDPDPGVELAGPSDRLADPV